MEAGDVADGTRLDQPRYDRGAERARATGNNDMTIAKVHA
jgi:hypothetical protein